MFKTRLVYIFLVLAAFPLLGASPKAEAVSPPTIRVLDRRDQKLPVLDHANRTPSSASGRLAEGVIPLPKGITLQGGETLEIHYADGTASYQAITSSCTYTSTVGNPFKTGNAVQANFSIGASAGCTTGNGATGFLAGWVNWFLGQHRTGVFKNALPGQTWYWNVYTECVSSDRGPWQSYLAGGPRSAQIDIACSRAA